MKISICTALICAFILDLQILSGACWSLYCCCFYLEQR